MYKFENLLCWCATSLLLTKMCISFSPGNCTCGLDYKMLRQRMIVGGKPAEPGKYPWQVGFYDGNKYYCAGTLINDKYILSAGHCFLYYEGAGKYLDLRKANITFVLGRSNLIDISQRSSDVITRYAKKIILHPKFRSEEYYSDISLVKLNKPIRKFDYNIYPVCLPTKNSSYEGAIATISGWGALRQGGSPSPKLQEVDVKVMADDYCKEQLKELFFYNVMICAALKGRDACQGDSGGPLHYKENHAQYTQIGIVSSGVGCGNFRFPGMFTRVTQFSEWIRSNTADANYCQN